MIKSHKNIDGTKLFFVYCNITKFLAQFRLSHDRLY